ncbi:MAG: type IV pilus biogenesis protein PilM [Acidobacteriaceae bacterium]
MQIFPTSISAGVRPRLACEVRPEGVVAARADDAAGVLAAVASAPLPTGALVPSLRPGNLVDRGAVVVALKRALDSLQGSTRDITLVVPDAALRVLLLDFDALPGKLADALPVVRFRLKKLLPFEADDAAVSYQVMSSGKNNVRVIAVAMPKAVLDEYEAAVRDAGYEPGAVLPSTLAALAAMEESEQPALMVNASSYGVTTAIVRAGQLLLHRSIDLGLDSSNGVALGEVEAGVPVLPIQPVVLTEAAIEQEIAQAISVAAAYYEDTLNTTLEQVQVAGPMGADRVQSMLAEEGFRMRELLGAAQMLAEAAVSAVPRGMLAGVTGALKS